MALFRTYETKVLLVCTANICRSPMAEGLLRSELSIHGLHKRVRVESAGTHAGNQRRNADSRAVRLLHREGIDISRYRSKQVKESDFFKYDYVLAMDEENTRWLLKSCPENLRDRIHRFSHWAQDNQGGVIPDPYFGDMAAFERVLELLRESARGFTLFLSAQ